MKKVLYIPILLLSFQLAGQPICDELLINCQPELDAFLVANINAFSCKQFLDNCDETSDIHRFGAVSIGTDQSAKSSLSVKQGIITNKVMITNSIASLDDKTVWGDHVFFDDYDLMSLNSVESFIQEKGHLPGFDSAKTIEERAGFELAEITLAQQIKIEEAFIHLIVLDEELSRLEKEKEYLDFEKELLLVLYEMNIK